MRLNYLANALENQNVIKGNMTYCFSNNFSVVWDINCGFEEHPCPFVTACIIWNIWGANLLVSSCFHPSFSSINRHIYSFNSTTTSWYCVSTYWYLQWSKLTSWSKSIKDCKSTKILCMQKSQINLQLYFKPTFPGRTTFTSSKEQIALCQSAYVNQTIVK